MAGDAIETAKQENGSRVFFESYIEKNITDFAKLLPLVKKFYPNVNSEWMSSYEKQAVDLKK